MRTSTLIAAAASLGGAAATFRGAPPFSCPRNTIETCNIQQENGFDWTDLAEGIFSNYGGFEFTGFECKTGSLQKRDGLTGRTFGRRAACGIAERRGGSSFGCGSSKDVEKFSIGHFDISVEFDIDLEFHYDMPDGSQCKHRSKCSKGGTTVENTQCGGARNVTVVVPEQQDQPKPSCIFSMHSISFACGTPTETVLLSTTSPTTSTEVLTTPTTTDCTGCDTEVSPTGSKTPVYPSMESPSAETSTPVESPTSETEAVDTTSTPVTTTIVNVTPSVSTVHETTVLTITSCEPTRPDCPGDGSDLVVTQIKTTTTEIPVSYTLTTVLTTSPLVENTSSDTVEMTSGGNVGTPSQSVDITSTEGTSTTSVSPETPLETLPCPEVVPSCLNTWLFTVNCASNTDASCYCPDVVFVENIFSCIYAHGETDDIIQEAVSYLQGICAGQVKENPAIVTGAESVTTCITPTATPVPLDIYTTYTVVKTTTVPCEKDGTTISESYTTSVISLTLNVPAITFSTDTKAGFTTPQVVIVPDHTTTAVPVVEPTETPTGASTLYTKPNPTGTGVPPTSNDRTTTPFLFVGAAAPTAIPVGAVALGFAGAVLAV